MKRVLILFAAAAALTSAANAHPLRMDYTVTDLGGGLYDYEFYFTLDNHDNSWYDGMGWGWIIIGDAMSQDSPLYDFAGDWGDFPVGPWDQWGWSWGYHNGPTLHYVLDCWFPHNVGEQLYFSGTSTVLLHEGEMLWSSIYTEGGAPTVEFEVAYYIPSPAAIPLLALGGLTLRKRRR